MAPESAAGGPAETGTQAVFEPTLRQLNWAISTTCESRSVASTSAAKQWDEVASVATTAVDATFEKIAKRNRQLSDEANAPSSDLEP